MKNTKCVYVYFNIFENFLFSSLQIVSSWHHNNGCVKRLGKILQYKETYTVFGECDPLGRLYLGLPEAVSFCGPTFTNHKIPNNIVPNKGILEDFSTPINHCSAKCCLDAGKRFMFLSWYFYDELQRNMANSGFMRMLGKKTQRDIFERNTPQM